MDMRCKSANLEGGEPELLVVGNRDLASAQGLAVVLGYGSGA